MYNYQLLFNNNKFYISDGTLKTFLSKILKRDDTAKQTFPFGTIKGKDGDSRIVYFQSSLTPDVISNFNSDFIQNYDFLTISFYSIKKQKVLKENSDNPSIKFGCLMVDMSIPQWDEILKYIKPEDLYTEERGYGLEKDPHATVLYGFHDDVKSEDVLDLLNEPVEITLKKISIFENEDKPYDVVKFELESKGLEELNSLMRDKFDYTNDYPDYNPHCTIAYVKKGKGKKYIKELTTPVTLVSRKFIYSNVDKSKEEKLVDSDIIEEGSSKKIILSERYTPEEIKKILWNTFTTKVRDIKFTGENELNELVFEIIPEEDFTDKDAEDTLGWLNNTNSFDAWIEAEGKIKVAFRED